MDIDKKTVTKVQWKLFSTQTYILIYSQFLKAFCSTPNITKLVEGCSFSDPSIHIYTQGELVSLDCVICLAYAAIFLLLSAFRCLLRNYYNVMLCYVMLFYYFKQILSCATSTTQCNNPVLKNISF